MLRSFSDGLGGVVRWKPWTRPTAPKPKAGTAHALAARRPYRSQDTFERDLDALLNSRAGTRLVGGALEFGGIEELRQLLASRWPDLANRLKDITEREVRALLEDGDLFRMHENATVLLCFVNIDQNEAERKTRLISDRIEAEVTREFPAAGGKLQPRHVLIPLPTTSPLPEGPNLSERLLNYIRAVKGDAGKLPSRRPPSFERAQFYFSPLWAPAKGMILLNRSIALGTPASPYPRRMQVNSFSRTQVAESDYIALSKTVQSIAAMLSLGYASPILVQVHFSTLNRQASSLVYRKLLESVSPTYRMLLALEVVGIPAGQPVGEILDATGPLKPLAKWLVLSLGLTDNRIAELNDELIWAVSTSLENARSTDSELFPALQRYQSLASKARLSTIVHGVNSIGLSIAAVKAGMTYLNGSAIHPVSTVPRALGHHNFSLSAISSSRIVKRWKY